MKAIKIIILLILVLNIFSLVICEPISLALAAAVSAVAVYFKSDSIIDKVLKLTDYFGQAIGYYEGCEDHWIPGNMEELEHEFKENLFGQPLAHSIILDALKFHLDNPSPERALMLSFHGNPGTGKNFVSNMIIKKMFRKGHGSEFVKIFRGSIDFHKKANVEQYKSTILREVKDKTYKCHRSVFVFDEVDKMPPGVLDVLSGLIKTERQGDYDFRRLIFILLSNVGAEVLTQATMKSYQIGIEREDMNLNALQRDLAVEAFNKEGGLQDSGLIKGFAITHYVPFLPLEVSHVEECLVREVIKLGQDPSRYLIEEVLESLPFKGKFSVGGCKGVAEKVGTIIQREIRNKIRRIS